MGRTLEKNKKIKGVKNKQAQNVTQLHFDRSGLY